MVEDAKHQGVRIAGLARIPFQMQHQAYLILDEITGNYRVPKSFQPREARSLI